MDGTGEHYAKWNKPGGEGQIPKTDRERGEREKVKEKKHEQVHQKNRIRARQRVRETRGIPLRDQWLFFSSKGKEKGEQNGKVEVPGPVQHHRKRTVDSADPCEVTQREAPDMVPPGNKRLSENLFTEQLDPKILSPIQDSPFLISLTPQKSEVYSQEKISLRGSMECCGAHSTVKIPSAFLLSFWASQCTQSWP